MAETETASEWVAPTGRDRWTMAIGREMVEAWRRSGESKMGFAARHGLGEHRVTYWIDRVDGTGHRGRSPGRCGSPQRLFAPVRVVDAAPEAVSEPVPLEVVIGAAVVRVPPGFDQAHLWRLVQALGGEA